jgi:hypothetical protein
VRERFVLLRSFRQAVYPAARLVLELVGTHKFVIMLSQTVWLPALSNFRSPPAEASWLR